MSGRDDDAPEPRELARLEVEASRELRGPVWKLAPEDRGYSVRCLARAAIYRRQVAREARVKLALRKLAGK